LLSYYRLERQADGYRFAENGFWVKGRFCFYAPQASRSAVITGNPIHGHSMPKIKVAVVFGGRSSEHEVSLASAVSILQNINREKYEAVPIKITRTGRWLLLSSDEGFNTAKALDAASGPALFAGDPEAPGFYILDGTDGVPGRIAGFLAADVVFPVLHGTFGEDGTVQGLIGLSNLPCVGAGVMASAIGMDKVLMKQVFLQNDLPCVDFIWFLRKKWKSDSGVILEAVRKEMGFPCFVKPANAGSSVGVYKAKNETELTRCIDAAAVYDRKILVEKAVAGRELECSVLGNDEPEASVVGEIVSANEFYDYEAKYLSERSKTIVPADLSEPIARAVRHFALEAFKALDCAGMARVDFFLERDSNRIFVNELNTIPGFTPISMYPKMWEAVGIPYPDLIDRLIGLAFERHRDVAGSAFSLGEAGGGPEKPTPPTAGRAGRNG
jgi:D-alanine-D-alanine ligase